MENSVDPGNQRISAIAFDLDGTLYPNYSLYIRLIPFLLKEQKYLRAFGKARDRLRQRAADRKSNAEDPGEGEFYQRQAQIMGTILKKDPAVLIEKTERIIYRGWEPLFRKVKLFPHVKETLLALREKGIKLGLLSDFPPEVKIDHLGLSGLWDTMLCSEKIGQLKPHPKAFLELARTMGFPPQNILYVGNSFSYDVEGAQNAGMKAAWIRPAKKYLFPEAKKKKADFVFHDYRQLRDFVIT